MTTQRGTAHPAEWLPHVALTTSGDTLDARTLYAGVACVNGTPISFRAPIAGASRGRCRFKVSATGSLAWYFCSPDGRTRYGSDNPTPVAVTANTETSIASDDIRGEAWCVIEFTPSGNGTVALCDFMAL